MKRLLTAIAALVMALTTASAQRLADFAVEAQYITDHMAVELGLTSVQRNSILRLNMNYLGGITSHRDISSKIWRTRNNGLRSILSAAQWRLYKSANYFYRPIGWRDGAYVHNIYSKYPKHKGDRRNDWRPGKPGKGKGHGNKKHHDMRPGGPERPGGPGGPGGPGRPGGPEGPGGHGDRWRR